ncbi:MAG: LacI family transcriptional regulator, partial [Actinobacteria bacterium]|nr:LacI family transcriptional regulator [Actinomycetota bacterium]
MRIKDIAREINISPTTISRVLNKKSGNYSKATEQKVLNAIKKYSYTPNIIARNLKRKKTFDLGILIPEFSFYSEIYLGAQKVAKKYGYNLILACSNYNKDYELAILKDFLERKIDGLIITTGFFNQSYLDEYENKKIPVVTLERISNKSKLPMVCYDTYKMMKSVIRHLIENNYKNPSLIV